MNFAGSVLDLGKNMEMKLEDTIIAIITNLKYMIRSKTLRRQR